METLEQVLGRINNYADSPCTCSHVPDDDLSEEEFAAIVNCLRCQGAELINEVSEIAYEGIRSLDEKAKLH